MTQHSVARLEQLDNHTPLRVQAGSEEVILIRQGDLVHAYQAHCPHEGAPLDEGALCGGLLVCPWHKAAFAVDEGAVCEPPALADLRRYPVQVKNGEILVDDQPLPRANPPRHSDARCFAVIGAGAAGSAAVATLLSHGFGGRLVWIDGNSTPPTTARPEQIRHRRADGPDEVPALLEPEALRQGHLERWHAKVRALDVAKRQILLADGKRLDYDAALVATGANPNAPTSPAPSCLASACCAPGRRRTPARCRRTGPAGGHRRRRLYRPGGGFGPAQVRRASACGQPP